MKQWSILKQWTSGQGYLRFRTMYLLFFRRSIRLKRCLAPVLFRRSFLMWWLNLSWKISFTGKMVSSFLFSTAFLYSYYAVSYIAVILCVSRFPSLARWKHLYLVCNENGSPVQHPIYLCYDVCVTLCQGLIFLYTVSWRSFSPAEKDDLFTKEWLQN